MTGSAEDTSSLGTLCLSIWVQQGGGPTSSGDPQTPTENPDNDEDLHIEYFNDQGNWIEIREYRGDVGSAGDIFREVFELPADAMHPSFQLRLRQSGGSGPLGGSCCDWWHFDDVYVYAPAIQCDDPDGDSICAFFDNCPAVANVDQTDSDYDGFGDACDNCPGTHNSDQTDPFNAGGLDADGDGIIDSCYNCPGVSNPDQSDTDLDGLGDACDLCPLDPDNDIDGDGVCGDEDNCPTVANSDQADVDGDSLGDVCDPCPNDADNDADGDGLCGDVDPCPFDPADDIDGDGICGDVDNCPLDANPGQEDSDENGVGDFCQYVPHLIPGPYCTPTLLDSTNAMDLASVTGNLDGTQSIPNLGFNFPFFSNTYSTLCVSGNGLLLFDGCTSDWTDDPIFDKKKSEQFHCPVMG